MFHVKQLEGRYILPLILNYGGITMGKGYLTTYLENGNPLSFQTWYKGTGNLSNRTYMLINAFSLIAWEHITSDIKLGTLVKHTLPNGYYFKCEVTNKDTQYAFINTGFYSPQNKLIGSSGSLNSPYNQYYYAYVSIRDWDKQAAINSGHTNETELGPIKPVTDNNPQFVDWTAFHNTNVYPDSTSYFFTPTIDFNNLPDMDWTKPDPYKNGGFADSDGVGGGGNFDTSSDVVPLPSLPEKSALSSGFISIYTPLAGELMSLSTYMWSDTFIDGVKKLYSNPSDSLIMLGIIPINIPSVIDSDVKIGGISTGISMHRVTTQFIEVDCGTINLNEFFGSCFDYQPYTQLQLYCPFSGYHDIDTDVCMSNSLNLRYNFDILSGTYIAYLLVNNSVMYQWSGQALTVLPTSAYNIDALIKGALATTASFAGAVATGGALAPIAGAMTVASVTSMKPNISHGGDVSSSAALLSVRQPHIIIKRPKQVLPSDYNKTSGYPAMYTATLSDLTGYTEIYNIHLEDMSCTDNEKSEIERLLKEGVII